MKHVLTIVFAMYSCLGMAAAKTPLEDELVWLSVDKETLRATLYTLPEVPKEPVALQSFRIAIGKEKGDKIKQGDNRTPEGIYFTLNHISEENLLVKKYGRVAIPLDFPNTLDQREGKTGYGIWLHGAGDDNRIAAENVTEGCVAFYNNDIVKVKNWLLPHQSAVIISTDEKSINHVEDRKKIHELTQGWIQSWSQRDIKNYIQYYAPDFSAQGKNKHAYERYKKRVFASYKNIKLKTNNLRVLTHPKYAISMMYQVFNGDRRFKSEGRKVLYWKKENNEWKIVGETFSNSPFNKLKLSNL